MSTRRKIALIVWIAAIAAVLLIILMVVVPRLADLDRYRPEAIARLEQQTGRKAGIGHLALTILPVLSVRADDVTLQNLRGLPGDFLEIHRIYAELGVGALLHRDIVIRSLKIENPTLSLLSNAQGQWNAAVLPTSPAARVRLAAWIAEPAPSIAITKVEIEHGRVTVASLLPSGEVGPTSLEAGGISASLEDVNAGAFGSSLSATGGEGGGARPSELMKIAWTAPEEAELPSPGALVARGKLSADLVRAGGLEATSVKSGLELHARQASFEGLTLLLCGGDVTGNVLWDSAPQPARYEARLALAHIDMARLLDAFPGARGKMTGKMEGQLDLSGSLAPAADPLANKEGTGQLTIRDGQLPTLQLNKNLMLLMKDVIRTGPTSSDPSSFHSIAADLEIGQNQIESRHIAIVGNGVNMDLSGTLALAGAGRLDYQGVAKITAQQNAFTNVLAGLLGAKMVGGQLTFPFTLTGTLDAPRFELKRNPLRR